MVCFREPAAAGLVRAEARRERPVVRRADLQGFEQVRRPPDDAGFFAGGFFLFGIELANDRFDARDFFFGTAHHDAVGFGIGKQGGRSAGGFAFLASWCWSE